MTWPDQIEVHTYAANVSAVWKYLKLSEKDAKIITSADNKRDWLVLHLMSPMRREIGAWCWFLFDDWSREMALNDL